jgi:hypothetical protein
MSEKYEINIDTIVEENKNVEKVEVIPTPTTETKPETVLEPTTVPTTVPTTEPTTVIINVLQPPLMTGADEVSLPTEFNIPSATPIPTPAPIPIPTPKPASTTNTLLVKLEEMVFYIKSILGNEKITATNIVIIATSLMNVVEQYKDLTGSQKKMLIIDTIKRVINENTNDVEERMALMVIVDFTLPPLIDTLISAINGNIKFEKKKIVSTLKKIFCC